MNFTYFYYNFIIFLRLLPTSFHSSISNWMCMHIHTYSVEFIFFAECSICSKRCRIITIIINIARMKDWKAEENEWEVGRQCENGSESNHSWYGFHRNKNCNGKFILILQLQLFEWKIKKPKREELIFFFFFIFRGGDAMSDMTTQYSASKQSLHNALWRMTKLSTKSQTSFKAL